MVTEAKEEQVEGTEETGKLSGTTAVVAGLKELAESSQESDTVSDDADTTTTEEPGEAPQVRTFTEDSEEFKNAVTRRAQSLKDKELKPVYDENQQLKKHVVELEMKAAHESEDNAWTRMEKAEQEELGDTPEVLDIQTTRRQAISMMREAKVKLEEANGKLQVTETMAKLQQAQEDMNSVLLTDDQELIEKWKAGVLRLVECDGPNHYDSILKEIKEEREKDRQRQTSEKSRLRNPARPDGSTPSGSGGMDASRLRGDAAVSEGLRRQRQKT